MVKVAIVGCCHGELNKIYNSLKNSYVELLIICGDFQAIRNYRDLDMISVPNKYKQLGDFHRYYSGELKAPVLTIFIGGNHESSGYLQELKYGGFVAPNIYYLGDFGSIYYKGLRITGQSGIWNEHLFMNRQVETIPFDNSTVRSIYHIKAKTFLKSYLMKDDKCIDISLSHDWPQDIVHYGDIRGLLKYKPFFKNDIETGKLGNPLAKILLHNLRSRYWFSAHLHVKFSASVEHENKKRKGSLTNSLPIEKKFKDDIKEESIQNEKKLNLINKEELSLDMDEENFSNNDNTPNKEELSLDMDEEYLSNNQEPVNKEEISLDMDNEFSDDKEINQIGIATNLTTEFLALDKCLPKRKYIEYLDIESTNSSSDENLYFDKRSIAINKVIENFVKQNSREWAKISKSDLLSIDTSLTTLVDELNREISFEVLKLNKLPDSEFVIDQKNFKIIAPIESRSEIPLKYWQNNQTDNYISKFMK